MCFLQKKTGDVRFSNGLNFSPLFQKINNIGHGQGFYIDDLFKKKETTNVCFN